MIFSRTVCQPWKYGDRGKMAIYRISNPGSTIHLFQTKIQMYYHQNVNSPWVTNPTLDYFGKDWQRGRGSIEGRHFWETSHDDIVWCLLLSTPDPPPSVAWKSWPGQWTEPATLLFKPRPQLFTISTASFWYKSFKWSVTWKGKVIWISDDLLGPNDDFRQII